MHLINKTFHHFYQKNYREIIDYAQELCDDGHQVINLTPHSIIPKGSFFNKESASFLDKLIQPNDDSINHDSHLKHSPYLQKIDKNKSDIHSFLSSLADLTLCEEDEIIVFPGYDIAWVTIATNRKVVLKTLSNPDKNAFHFDDYRYLINSRTKWIVLDHNAYFYNNLHNDFLSKFSEYLLDFPNIIIIDLLSNNIADKTNNICKIEPRLTFRNIIIEPKKIKKTSIYIPKVLLEFLYFFKLESLPFDPSIIEMNIKTIRNLLDEKTFQINSQCGALFIHKKFISSYENSPLHSEHEAIFSILNKKGILVDEGSMYGMQNFIALGLTHEPTLFSSSIQKLLA
ncbi:MAG: hypothetical protein C0432_04745 [Candidatus Puniceispirillum sp.]|nr:hypothetical protein [Candidatus Pelagibacter sp.]MBA4283582.1 hypothetical protein [Candidatus Puniceispirillum sp.]